MTRPTNKARRVKAKPVKAWCIQDRCDGYLWAHYCRYLRRDCVDDWCEDTEMDWTRWRADGKECVRVLITALPK